MHRILGLTRLTQWMGLPAEGRRAEVTDQSGGSVPLLALAVLVDFLDDADRLHSSEGSGSHRDIEAPDHRSQRDHEERTRRLIERFAKPIVPSGALASLTSRETHVLKDLARGLSNTEVAADLQLSEATVKTHVARLLAKLGVRDRVQAVIAACEGGLVGNPRIGQH